MALGPLISAVAGKVVAPLFSKGGKLAAKGLMKTIDSPPLPTGTSSLTLQPQKSIAESLAANAQNDLRRELFYSSNPALKALGEGIGLGKTIYSSTMEQLDPRLLAMRRREGISHRTKKQVSIKLDELDTIRSDLKADDLLHRPKKELTKKELRKRNELEAREKAASKTIGGQLLYQQLQSKQQGTPSRILDETLLPENFAAWGVLKEADGTVNLQDFINIKDIKAWETADVWGEKRMATALKKIMEIQDDVIPEDRALRYFVRHDYASDATGNLAYESTSGPRTRAIARFLRDEGKIYKDIWKMSEDIGKALHDNPKYFIERVKKNKLGFPVTRKTRSGKRVEVTEKGPVGVGKMFEVDKQDGVIWFDDSYKSSDYSLGGVNTINFIERDGTRGTILNDIHDIAGAGMPSGHAAITFSLPKVSNIYVTRKKAGQSQAKYNRKVEEIIKRMGGKPQDVRNIGKTPTKRTKQTPERLEQLRQGRDIEERVARVEAIIPRTLALGKTKTQRKEAYVKLMKDYKAGTLSVPQTKVARDIQALDYKLSDLTLKDWMEYLGKIGIGVGVGVGLFGDE
jgi:hypothetical protein